MKLTIFGATGGVGRQAVRQALAAGHSVTAVVRDPARFDVAEAPGLTVATVADQSIVDDLVPPIAGSDAVISGVGPSGARDGAAIRVTEAILGALAETGVSRLVAVSAQPLGDIPAGEGLLGRALTYPIVRFVLRGEYRELGAMESAITASGAEWTMVRPPRLLDAPAPGDYRTAVGGNVPNGRTVSRADVAQLMLAVLDDPATIRQPVGVAR